MPARVPETVLIPSLYIAPEIIKDVVIEDSEAKRPGTTSSAFESLPLSIHSAIIARLPFTDAAVLALTSKTMAKIVTTDEVFHRMAHEAETAHLFLVHWEPAGESQGHALYPVLKCPMMPCPPRAIELWQWLWTVRAANEDRVETEEQKKRRGAKVAALKAAWLNWRF